MDLTRLIELATRYTHDKAEKTEGPPGLAIFRRNHVSDIEACVYEPAICLILQGAKTTASADREVDLRPGDSLLVSHDLPVVSRIIEASPRKPYLALILTLDMRLVRELRDELAETAVNGTEAPAPSAKGVPVSRLKTRSLAAAPADPAWLAPLIRYFELMESPEDGRILGPATRREIHYRLLRSPIGAMLRQLLAADSQASRVAKAIHQVRAGFRAPLSVPDLARTVGMSPSSFHQHFKQVTGTTPLQYQKDLRLIEAKSLLAGRDHSVSQAAYAVGYESPTHFSRDYSRKFGQPPSRDGLR